MKILQLCHKPQRRGAEVAALGLAAALRRQGHEAEAAFLYPAADRGGFAPEARVLGGVEGSLAERMAAVDPRLLTRLARFLDRSGPDVVQLNGASTVKYGALCRRRQRRGWAVVYRNIGRPSDWLRGPARRFFYRRLVLPAVDGVVAISRQSLSELIDFYHLQVPVTTLPNGIDPQALVPGRPRSEIRLETGTPATAPVVIQMGSLSREKRPDRLLDAFHALRRELPGARLWFLGDGPLRADLENRCRQDLPGAVSFLGSQAEVASYLAAADVLALTSDTEGIPAAALEAGYLRLPVVATRVGGLPECVEDGETGLLVDPQDGAGLRRALVSLLRDPQRRSQLGEAAHKRVAEEFTLDRLAQRFADFYHQVLMARRHGGDRP